MPFELQPILKGELVELRPLRADDFDSLYAVASDPFVWELHPDRERYKEDVFREFFRVAMETGGAFLVTDPSTNRVIGSTRYFGYDAERSEIEIGWTFLARSHWGGHHNREMKRLMLEHAFKFVDRVIFLVGPENFRSRRAVEKIGGIERGRVFKNDRESVVYEITAERFRNGPLQPVNPGAHREARE